MLLVTVLLLQLLLLLHLTDSCASRCCGRPIWSIENHKFDAFLDVCDRKIHTDTYRYALRNTVRYSRNTVRYALLSKLHMCMYS
jgi:hypothetical protein